MGRSEFLDSLGVEAKKEFIIERLKMQKDFCFICETPLDLVIQKFDIDHVVPGIDKPDNLAVTHSECNREKQDLNLEVARAMKRFDKIKEQVYGKTGKSLNISHILEKFGGSKHNLPVRLNGEKMSFSLEELPKSNQVYKLTIYRDPLSGFKSFFALLPIEYIFRDDKDINPRSISDKVKKLIKEFYLRRPQLQVSLARINFEGDHANPKVFIFDGQHKAAAQILLGI